jgi:hypothetical protein
VRLSWRVWGVGWGGSLACGLPVRHYWVIKADNAGLLWGCAVGTDRNNSTEDSTVSLSMTSLLKGHPGLSSSASGVGSLLTSWSECLPLNP